LLLTAAASSTPLAQLLSGAHQGVEFLFQALLLHENTFQYVLQEEKVEEEEEEEEEGEGGALIEKRV
tara:strand:- start:191 stop:391 length:201 start_codon:yes stop_codon:yes gene_type:complete